MSRVKPVDQDAIAALDDLFAPVVERMGFIPLSQLVMAHKPALLRALTDLGKAVYSQDEGSIPFALKSLIGNMASRSAGCPMQRPRPISPNCANISRNYRSSKSCR
jgi:hypothetical protein